MFGLQPQNLKKMIHSILNRRNLTPLAMRSGYTKLKRVQVEKDGLVRSTVQFVEHMCNSASKGKKPIDYSIVNLLAVGAYNMQKPMYLRDTTDFTFVDSFEKSKNSKL